MKRLLLSLYRLRGVPMIPCAIVLLVNPLMLQLSLSDPLRRVWIGVVLAALALFVLYVLLVALGGWLAPTAAPRLIRAPVYGRWLALNSPTNKVPSHGVRMYGQAYAIDLVAEPEEPTRPAFGGEFMRAASEYPAFGQPVHSPVAGVVVSASDRRRDHRARSNVAGLLYMNLEGMVRSLGGPSIVIGNHVTVRTDDGAFVTVAHLQQYSATVKVSDRVNAGALVGLCGNSGNSSEPHVHLQLTDRKSFHTGQGLPFNFTQIQIEDGDDLVDGLPANGEHMRVVGASA